VPSIFLTRHAPFGGGEWGAGATATALWCDTCTASVYELVLLPQVVYVVCWAVPYYLLLFCLAAGYIERNKCDTLYKLTLSTNPAVKSIVTRAPECLVTTDCPSCVAPCNIRHINTV
jgi:hypothetical protein